MKLLLKEGKIYSPHQKGILLDKGDILIEDDRIKAIEKNIKEERADKIINCQKKLVMPGLINSHMHSDENFFRGKLDNLPLELWMLYSCPPLNYGPFSNRIIYLRTMLGAIEMVQNGITGIQDDVSQNPAPTLDGYNSVFKAYKDIGLRANVALNVNNKKYTTILPFTEELIPVEIREKLDQEANSSEELIDLYEQIIDKWNNKDKLKVTLSSSAPQRCTDKHLQRLWDLSEEYNLPLHTHVLETKVQRVSGTEFYGKTIIEHLNDLGLLNKRLSINHSVWVDDNDMKLMADNDVTVIHNPISNLKLGSGIMPFIDMYNKGINITLGTDGTSSNDSLNMFEVMKMTGLLHKTTTPDYNKWPDSHTILNTTTINAAQSLGRKRSIGTLETGKKADLIILDLNNSNFIPLNDIENQLVYCEDGRSVETVIIDGNIIMEDNKLTNINKEDIYEEINEVFTDFKERYKITKEKNDEVFPYIDKIYKKCINEEVKINRFIDMHD